MPNDKPSRPLELLLEFYVREINFSRRIGWKHGPPPAPVMNVVGFFNELVGDLSEIHKCAVWERRKLPCPFRVFEEAGIMKGDPPDDPPPGGGERSPRPAPKVLVPGRRRAEISAIAEAEAVVAASAEKFPVGATGRSLAEDLGRGAAGVGVGVAAALAIRKVARGFAGGGFHFPSVLDPRLAPAVR